LGSRTVFSFNVTWALHRAKKLWAEISGCIRAKVEPMAKIAMPDGLPPDSAVKKLYEELHDLHERAGLPSTRMLGKRLDFTPNRVYNVFHGNRGLPNRPDLIKIVEERADLALIADIEGEKARFDSLWESVRLEYRRTNGAAHSDDAAQRRPRAPDSI
jgi:hypothetical protein